MPLGFPLNGSSCGIKSSSRPCKLPEGTVVNTVNYIRILISIILSKYIGIILFNSQNKHILCVLDKICNLICHNLLVTGFVVILAQ